MARPLATPSTSNLRAAAQTVRAAIADGKGISSNLADALTAMAGALDQAQSAIEVLERKNAELASPDVLNQRRTSTAYVSGDRIIGGVQIQGGLATVAGQGLDLTFEDQVATIASKDHKDNSLLALLIQGSTISFTGTISLGTVLAVTSGGTGTATGSITGTGDLTFTAGGSNKTVALVSSGTGKVVAKPGTNSTTAIQLQNAAGTAIVNVDTTNGVTEITRGTVGYVSRFRADTADYAFVYSAGSGDFEIGTSSGKLQLDTNATVRITILSTGNVGVGSVVSPTAALHLPAAAAAANSASLKIDPGTVATTPVSGNIESDGTHLYWTDAGGTRKQLD